MLSDVLDEMGCPDCLLPACFMPNCPNAQAFGAARTIQLARLSPDDDPNDVHGGLALLDSLRQGEVVVVAGGCLDWAYWGELMSTAASRAGASGTVVDGLSRDAVAVRELGYPVFARGWYARDIKGRGKVVGIDLKVTVAGIDVSPGQWIYADGDGIAVVPSGAEAELAERVRQQLDTENLVKQSILAGDRPSDLVAKHGVF